MAALTQTNTPTRHDTGDLIVRFYDLSGTNGDTFTPSGQTGIRQVICTATTAIAIGATFTDSVITFVTLGAWAGKIGVWSRKG